MVRRPSDLVRILTQHWYRVPCRQKLARRPAYLAFYQTRSCGPDGAGIRYYGRVKRVFRLRRSNLLPGEKEHPRAREFYWKFHLGRIQKLPRRIENRLRFRITFAYTSLSRLRNAREMGDLFAIPPLERIMANILTQDRIGFIPQYCVLHRKRCKFRLDFALFSGKGKVALECDHSRWHKLARQKARDREKDRWLLGRGWKMLHVSEDDLLGRPEETLRRIRGLLGGSDQ